MRWTDTCAQPKSGGARGYKLVSPLMDIDFDKAQSHTEFERITGFLPEAYKLGLDHNNCDLCVKGGHAFFARCLYYREQQYQQWARRERLHQQVYKHASTILRDRSGGTTTPLALDDFEQQMRERWAQTMVLPGMEDLMFFGLEETPACRFCDSAA